MWAQAAYAVDRSTLTSPIEISFSDKEIGPRYGAIAEAVRLFGMDAGLDGAIPQIALLRRGALRRREWPSYLETPMTSI